MCAAHVEGLEGPSDKHGDYDHQFWQIPSARHKASVDIFPRSCQQLVSRVR